MPPLSPPSLVRTDHPCVRNCCLNQEDVCIGCGRTLAEIRSWQRLSERQRQDALALAQGRLQAIRRPARE